MGTTTYNINRRRIRASHHIRELAANIRLSHKDFIQPLFVDETISTRTPVTNLNEVYADTIETLIAQIRSDLGNGISKFLLFPVVAKKSEQQFDFSFVIRALEVIRNTFGKQVWIATDVCLCAYTTHGHCGILNEHQDRIQNEKTVKTLAEYALQLASAGADCIAPSDMMDGRIGAIRNTLDENGFETVTILSYSSKFCSQFYGPFRDVCKSSPSKNLLIHNRKSYQISPFNADDALLSATRDIEEGADFVMVKPATHYLDIIQKLKQQINYPVAAYHVSGEYQSIELLAEHGLSDRQKTHTEVWTSLKRAGADIIISYAARNAKQWIEQIDY
jgi:porphobilinogen synthase